MLHTSSTFLPQFFVTDPCLLFCLFPFHAVYFVLVHLVTCAGMFWNCLCDWVCWDKRMSSIFLLYVCTCMFLCAWALRPWVLPWWTLPPWVLLSDAHVATCLCDCVLFACLKKGLGKWWRRRTVSRLWADRSSWEWSHLSIRPVLTLSASLMDWSMPAFVLSTSPWKMSSKAR